MPLVPLLQRSEVLSHAWIRGELALGHLGPRRKTILADLARLPAASVITEGEVFQLIDSRSLAGTGIGWVDAQILGSALLAGAGLWTFDGKLERVARRLGCAPVLP